MATEIHPTTRQLQLELQAAKEHLAAQSKELERLRALVRLDRESLSEVLGATGFRTLEQLRRCSERAFELAYFVLGDSGRAFDAGQEALSQLADERRRQKRRRGYRRLASRPRKAYLDPPQACQALLLGVMTTHELEQEQGRGLADQDLVIRLVKLLIEASLDARSWRLNLAMSCLLRGADLKEAWCLQRLLEQDSDPLGLPKEYVSDPLKRQMKEDKTKLEQRLTERFQGLAGDSAITWRRLEAAEIMHWAPALKQTLDRLRIWDAPKAESLIAAQTASDHDIPALRATSSEPAEIARVEQARKVVLMSPTGFARLAARLELSHLDSRWQMPHFFSAQGAQPPDPPSFDLPVLGGRLPEDGLSDEQFQTILARLAVEAGDANGGITAGEARAQPETAQLDSRSSNSRVSDSEAPPAFGLWRWLDWLRHAAWGPKIAAAAGAAIALMAAGSLFLAREEPVAVAGVAFRQLEPSKPVQRSTKAVRQLRVPRHAESLVLVIPVEVFPAGAEASALEYLVELVYPSGKIWRPGGELRPIDGELTLALPTSELGPGTYMLRFSVSGATRYDVEEITFRVNFDD